MAKLEDVAKKAGVSVTTVSRVINNYGYLGKETVKKVHLAMEELNYLPNPAARSLQGKGTNLIGLIFPDVSSPFFGEMIWHLETIFFKKGYKVILCNSGSDKDKERDYLRMLLSHKVDGIIAGAHNAGIEEYETATAPIISFDRSLSKNIPIVSSDNYTGGKLATETLILAGAKKISIITGNNTPNLPTYRRYEGYVDVLNAHGMEPILHECVHPTILLKTMQIQSILKNSDSDGYFCTDDLTAILLINEAKKMSIRVPQDIKVVGYDATEQIKNYYPFLTTISQPIEDCAILLSDLLQKRIANPKEQLEKQYLLPVHLVFGSSV